MTAAPAAPRPWRRTKIVIVALLVLLLWPFVIATLLLRVGEARR